MYYLLFRNRWFAAIWALGILGTAYGVAMRGTASPETAAANTRASEAALAQWSQEDSNPAELTVEDDGVDASDQDDLTN